MKKRLLTICTSLLVVVLCGFLFVGCNYETLDGQKVGKEYDSQEHLQEQEASVYGARRIVAKDIFIMCDSYLYFGNLYLHEDGHSTYDNEYELYGIELPNGQYILTDKRIMAFTKKPDAAVYSYTDLTEVK